MQFYRNKHGQLVSVPTKFDETTGRDVNREKMLAKGYEPLALYNSPDLKRKVFVPQTTENMDKMKAKGWKLPFEVEQGQEGGALLSGTVTRDEVQTLANKHGVSFEELDSLMEFVGANPDYREPDKTKQVLSTLGRGAGANIPQFLYREVQTPAKQKAMSDLQELAYQRMSTTQAGAEMLGGFLTPYGTAGKAATLGKKALGAGVAAGMGALTGAAAMEEGDEGLGVILGLGLTILPASIAKATQKALPKSQSEIQAEMQELIKSTKGNRGKNIEELIQETRQNGGEIISIRERAILEGKFSQKEMEQLGAETRRLKPNIDKVLERRNKVLEKQKKPLITEQQWNAELGSIDLDRQKLKLAQTLGWTGKTSTTKKGLLKPKKFAAEVSQATQFIAEKKTLPGGQQEVAQAFRRMTDASIATEKMKTIFKQDAKERFVPLRRFFESVADGKYVARGIDRRLGTNLEGAILEMDNATNSLTYILSGAQAEIRTLAKQAKKAGLDTAQFREVLEFGTTPAGKLTPEQTKAVDQVKEFFERHRQTLETAFQFKIPPRDNYFPHLMPSTLESISRIKQRAKQVIEQTEVDLNARLKEPSDKLRFTPEEFKLIKTVDEDFVQALQLISKEVIVDGDSLLRAYRTAISPGASKAPMQATEASAAFLREDKIPSFLLQNDLETAGMNWIQETYRHVLIKDQLAEMQRIRDIAVSLKDERAAAYLNGLLDDLTGLRVGTLASEATKARIAMRAKVEDTLQNIPDDGSNWSRVSKSALRTIRDLPELWSTMVSMAYPNFLGLSARAMLMNLSQIPTMTMPELGLGLSMKYTPKVMARISKTILNGSVIDIKNPYLAAQFKKNVGDSISTRKPWVLLQNEGYLSKQYTQEMVDALRNDMKLSLPVNAFKQVSAKYSNAAMFFFSKTEEINRLLAVNYATELGEDLLKGSGEAIAWLKNVKGAQQLEIAKRIEAGDAEGTVRLVQEYILSKTILNYTRQSMSEFGRFMGPVFSMFTKWPSTVYGDIVEQYASKTFWGANVDIAKRYLAPWAFLAATNVAIYEAAGKRDEKAVDTLLGSRGLAGWAPITSVEALVGGEFLKSPSADIASSVTTAIMNPQDPAKLVRAFNDAAMTFLPGMALGRLLLQDLPRLTGDGQARFELLKLED